MRDQVTRARARALPAALALCAVFARATPAQDRLKLMPGYDNWVKTQQQIQQLRLRVVSGAVTPGGQGTDAPGWSADGKAFSYTWNKKSFRFDLATKKTAELPADSVAATARQTTDATPAASGPCSAAVLNRDGPSMVVASPNGARHAIARARNVMLGNADCSDLTPITIDGNVTDRIRYGTTPWVYGEELDQSSAMWWNPAGTKLAYYRFDESKIPDFHIVRDQTSIQTTLAVEAYPKAGGQNPVPDLFVYDVSTKRSTRVDIRDGKPFANDVMGHYVSGIEWSPDGSELFASRRSRRQDVIEFVACRSDTGNCRVIIREEWPTGWAVEERPSMRFLADRSRFIWISSRNGFRNFYLYDLTGRLINPITQHQFEVVSIVRVDEKTSTLWYLARDGDNFMKVQLHKVGLDGRNDRRLTDPRFNHQVHVAPDGRSFVDVAETLDQPPFTQVVDVTTAKPFARLATSDYSAADSLGFRRRERFQYLAADGKTQLFGSIAFPSDFDPEKRYPTVMSVYGGPNAASAPLETFTMPSANWNPFGFITIAVHTRASQGLGKRALDDVYRKLGQTEVDDMAAGVKALWNRPWFAKDRVGIFGLSYGGYSSLMALLRYPDVFAAAIAMSPVTDWRNYDTIYTERYMGMPDENKDGYDKGSAMSYVDKLKGDLLIFYGTADDNVHSTNSLQLIKALQAAGKHFVAQVGPDEGHTGIPIERAREFLIHSLVIKPKLGLVY